MGFIVFDTSLKKTRFGPLDVDVGERFIPYNKSNCQSQSLISLYMLMLKKDLSRVINQL